MPIYEYHCDSCGTDFEELVFSAADQMNVTCKSCSSDRVTKLMSGAAVVSGASKSTPSYTPPKGGGGCCGGNCGCH